MAKAREGYGGAGSLEAELTCPICQGLYREPVSLSCGHNFCRQCCQDMVKRNRYYPCYYCPTCGDDVGSTQQLKKNFHLGNIVKAFKATTSKGRQDEGSEEWNAGAVPCEYCLDRPQPAVKTCLVCNVSLCKAHLNKHNTKASQQEHILVEVGADEAQERRCPEHGKLLECYCQNEDKCICVLCSIAGAHKGHEVITMKEERDKQLVRSSSLPMAPALAAGKGESRRKGGRAFTGHGEGCEGSPAAAPGISSPPQQGTGALCWTLLFIPSCVLPEQCGS